MGYVNTLQCSADLKFHLNFVNKKVEECCTVDTPVQNRHVLVSNTGNNSDPLAGNGGVSTVVLTPERTFCRDQKTYEKMKGLDVMTINSVYPCAKEIKISPNAPFPEKKYWLRPWCIQKMNY